MADMLATPESLASLLQQDLDTATATVVLEAATAVVQEAAGRQRLVEVADDTAELIGGTDSELWLPQRPVTAVASVELDGEELDEGTASGTWRRFGPRLWRDIGWQAQCYTPSRVVVVYSHGFADGAQELQLARAATLSLAREAYANPSGVVREQIDDYSVAFEAASRAMDASPFLRRALQRQYGRRAGLVRI